MNQVLVSAACCVVIVFGVYRLSVWAFDRLAEAIGEVQERGE